MPATSHICAVSDAVVALLPLLTPAERAAVAGAILHGIGAGDDNTEGDGLPDDVLQAFADELTDDDLDALAPYLDR